MTTTASPVERPRTNGIPAPRYALNNLTLTLRRVPYIVFVVAMPLVMYVLFNQIYGSQQQNNLKVGTWIMVNMACYGALGAAMNSGASLQMERRSGWFRQLAVAGLSGRGYLFGKLSTALVLMIPTIGIIFLVGSLTGIDLTGAQWLKTGLLIWVTVLPMVLVGLNVALWFSADAAQPANTIVLMILAILGGLWFPADSFPHVMQIIAKGTPTYWIQKFSTWPFDGEGFPTQGVWVILIWTAVLAYLAYAGFRRAARNSKR